MISPNLARLLEQAKGQTSGKTHPGYEYKNVPVEDTIEGDAQKYSDLGWETVSVIPAEILSGSRFWLLIKRPKQNPYPNNGITGNDYDRWEREHGGVDWR